VRTFLQEFFLIIWSFDVNFDLTYDAKWNVDGILFLPDFKFASLLSVFAVYDIRVQQKQRGI